MIWPPPRKMASCASEASMMRNFVLRMAIHRFLVSGNSQTWVCCLQSPLSGCPCRAKPNVFEPWTPRHRKWAGRNNSPQSREESVLSGMCRSNTSGILQTRQRQAWPGAARMLGIRRELCSFETASIDICRERAGSQRSATPPDPGSIQGPWTSLVMGPRSLASGGLGGLGELQRKARRWLWEWRSPHRQFDIGDKQCEKTQAQRGAVKLVLPWSARHAP
ncbi:uncharacterized protein B0I36DRAFT_138848 [Microdochium trichocladiopsis]|uniref:Uncharacterized protein n=1 Tax=Microdochium trichocladiopsis TaxID=1682393 RepID=A0A9P8Y1H5_9PEZI|nr:uncharacterized protein B0I36DRAFT_138848 [Microdochium trichocladiopsis]KAH7027467.1 hypothetical protein B0I36DRAFT_138848 [Microdochium trichocladiopsis]